MSGSPHPAMPPGTNLGGLGPQYAIPRWPNSRFAFLPLNEEATLSTRGQRLPGVIRNRSTTSLRDMRNRYGSFATPRGQTTRPKSPQEEDLEIGRTRTQDTTGEESGIPQPPPAFPIARPSLRESFSTYRKKSMAPDVLMAPEMRSQRLIGNSNPRYRWEQYYKSEAELKAMTKPLRKYYERNNYLVQQYLYIDRLLDSSLPHDLVQEYGSVDVPITIHEEPSPMLPPTESKGTNSLHPNGTNGTVKVKRTKDLYKLHDEETPLFSHDGVDEFDPSSAIPAFQPDDEAESGDKVVSFAIYLNFAANAILLVLKIIVVALSSSLSVLASLVDAALDFLSTFIVWTTSRLISSGKEDVENYPVGRRRLEPIGVLVFSVIMITSFVQVAIEAIQRLMGNDHEVVQLTIPAIAIMASTVIIKFLCWLWCRLIRNSSVQALAQDAMTDVVFNIFSIIFPLVGYYARVWWLDPLGGLLLSLYVIINWSLTTRMHIHNLTGRAASADERNILLYLTMRFAHTIKHIQGLAAYHAGDKLNVEVDIVLDSDMSLRDSHDLGESLQYVLESVPGVERAFVHADYKSENLPSHMRQ